MFTRIVTFIIVATIIWLCTLQAACTLHTNDDGIWYTRALCPVWRPGNRWEYILATDVPGMVRVYYNACIGLTRPRGAPPIQDVTLTVWGVNDAIRDVATAERRRNGQLSPGAPSDCVFAMRIGNALAFLVGLAALYYVSWSLVQRPLVALLPLTPFVISPRWPVEVIPRAGPDALLFAWCCVFLAVWTFLHQKRWATRPAAVLLMGFLAGLAAYSKVNGAIVVVGYAAYLAAAAHGWRRFALPVLAVTVAFAVYFAANPGFYGYTPMDVVRDVIIRRRVVRSLFEKRDGPLASLETWNAIFPSWSLLPAFVYLWWRSWSREMIPVLIWGAVLVVGTAIMIDRDYPRYVAPLELGLWFPTALSIIILCRSGKKR